MESIEGEVLDGCMAGDVRRECGDMYDVVEDCGIVVIGDASEVDGSSMSMSES